MSKRVCIFFVVFLLLFGLIDYFTPLDFTDMLAGSALVVGLMAYFKEES